MSTNITLDDWQEYRRIQKSGIINMLDLKNIELYSGGLLGREKFIYIQKHFLSFLARWETPYADH